MKKANEQLFEPDLHLTKNYEEKKKKKQAKFKKMPEILKELPK